MADDAKKASTNGKSNGKASVGSAGKMAEVSANGATALANPNGVIAEEAADFILRGDASPIDLAGIEKGLTALWQAAGKPRQGDSAPPVTRACVLNLIIMAEDEAGLVSATDIVAQLTWTYPCRAIVLLQKPDAPENTVNAWISAHCQLPDPSGKKVCCEQITIEGSGTGTDNLISIVLPLLVPDLPVVLWVPGNPKVDSELFHRLLETSDRLIFDSRSFLMPALLFNRLTNLATEEYKHLAFSDLNWSRLTPWRGLIAQFFDPLDLRSYLEGVDRIEVEYEAPFDNDQPNFSEALLLVGWLASTLGWQPAFTMKQRGGDGTFILNRAGQPLNVYFYGHNERQDDLGGITAVRIFATLPFSSDEAVFSLALSEDYEHATTNITVKGQPVANRVVIIPKRDQAQLVHEDLGVMGHDIAFEQAALLAGKFAGFR